MYSINVDNTIKIDIKWPFGTYALLEPIDGCPEGAGFTPGCRYSDNEDSSNANAFPSNIGSLLKRYFGGNTQLCYCTRDYDPGDSVFDWQKGQYCIGKYSACPSGFKEGTVYWDDEDDGNANKDWAWGALPDGGYDGNTKIRYCCRNDGLVSSSIVLVLPNMEPFVLWPNVDDCQGVVGMSSSLFSIYIYIYTDDEDSSKGDTCYGDYPLIGSNCSTNNIRQYLCYYTPA